LKHKNEISASETKIPGTKGKDAPDITKLSAYLATNSIVLKKSAVDGSSNLYGSVTASDVVEALNSLGHANINSVEISAHIKTLGEHKIKVEGLDATVSVIAASS
jgi:ribosomal protein L9